MKPSLLLAIVMGSQLSRVGSCKASMDEGTGTARNKPAGERLGPCHCPSLYSMVFLLDKGGFLHKGPEERGQRPVADTHSLSLTSPQGVSPVMACLQSDSP